MSGITQPSNIVDVGFIRMLLEDVKLRPCCLRDLDSLISIYHEAFRDELTFFFKRFHRPFFEELFNMLIKDTLVAESRSNVVGFIITTRGFRPITHVKAIWLLPRLVSLLTVSRYALLVYVLQKLRNADWARPQVGLACIVVRREWRRKGVGSRLISEALAKYPDENVGLEVRPWNTSALRLYTRAGFRKTGAWSDPRGGWIVMKRTKAPAVSINPGNETCNL